MALTRLETGRQVALKQCAEKVRWLGTELELERSAASWNLKEVLTCASSCDASNAWPLGPAVFFREVRKKRTIDLGPIWSHKWWEMVPDTHLQKIHVNIHGEKWSQRLFKCWYLSTDLLTQSINHGRYRRSRRIHLLQNTVDINGRCWFTYWELRSIVNGRLKIEIFLWLISSMTPVQEWENRTPNATNKSIVHFLLFPGSQYSFTAIT